MKCRYMDEITDGKGVVFCNRYTCKQLNGGIIYYATIFAIYGDFRKKWDLNILIIGHLFWRNSNSNGTKCNENV